tara:strand:- start:308 stop:523 length:216 start_codon:yes stop_codon:yes gene_type:complete
MTCQIVKTAPLVLLIISFVLVAFYKFRGGKTNLKMKYIGEVGKVVFFIGLLIMAVNQMNSNSCVCTKQEKK